MAAFDDIRTVFIDLDDTIWDFTANSKVAMREVYAKYGLTEKEVDFVERMVKPM